MDWLSQNWIWVLVAIGAGIFFFRGGHRSHAGGLGGSLGGLLGGMGHGGHEGHGGSGSSRHGGHGEQPDRSTTSNAPEATIDPVNGEPVRTDKALTSLYQGKIYYFASKENRDRFEAAPQEYAQKAAGHPVGPVEAANERPRRRHGC